MSRAPSNNPSIDNIRVEAYKHHLRRFGNAPKWTSIAPGRVNLIGEHVDYNDGCAITMAIDRYVLLTASLGHRSSGKSPVIAIYSASMDEQVSFELGSSVRPLQGAWQCYVLGVLDEYMAMGVSIPSLDITVVSSLPIGGGLSSSAALEAAVAQLVSGISGEPLDRTKAISICRKVEHEWAGVPCGSMDQTSVLLSERGRLLWIDFESESTAKIIFDDKSLCVIVFNSGVKHALVDSAYAERLGSCTRLAKYFGRSLRHVTTDDLMQHAKSLDPADHRRARHVITEIERTKRASIAARQKDWQSFGRRMFESHESLRDDYEVSSRELDTLVSLCEEKVGDRSVLGAKMTGAGFGGCIVAIARVDKLTQLVHYISDAYSLLYGKRPHYVVSNPVCGSRLIR